MSNRQRFSDNEIVKALKRMSEEDPDGFSSDVLDLINRLQKSKDYYKNNRNEYQDKIMYIAKQCDNLQAGIDRLKSMNQAKLDTIHDLRADIERLERLYGETAYKLECLLCYATGNKLSKHTYPLKTMEIAVSDYIQECCDKTASEARKEFSKRLKEISDILLVTKSDISGNIYSTSDKEIDNLLKELEGEG